uniref:NudC domain-containing protein 1 n=1 Tax=Caenorhabditis tropicalis TaxID=1561998 RepID=A0A1I7T7R5_9PELO
METIQLAVDRTKLDANFDGYKVSVDNKYFESQQLEQDLCLRSPSNKMVTMQHMKVFSNDNQLFSDAKKSTESHEYLYRILDTGHIQFMLYDKKYRKWDTSIIGNLEMEKNNESAFPTSIQFTEDNLVVVCDGVSRIHVFLSISETDWVNMLDHKVTDIQGLSLIEARVLNKKLHILAYEIENGDDKKTRSRIHWLTVKLDDIDYSETLTVEKETEIIQNGHFETCTFSNDGSIIFLASEKPHMNGLPDASTVSVIEQSWLQNENIVEVTFKLSASISEEDIDISVTKTGIQLSVKETRLLNGKLGGEIEETGVEICADPKTNTLILKLKTTENKKWEKLIAIENSKLETPMEECDEPDSSLKIYWVNMETGKVVKQCDVSGSQVLFSRHDCYSPATVCLRHDVDGILWSFDEPNPRHVSTLQAFGYVQASKTNRVWTGCSPNHSMACIVEGGNRVLLYSQKVEVSGNLSNRKTSQTVSHVAKQHLLRLECANSIRGVHLTDTLLFTATKQHIHVAEL